MALCIANSPNIVLPEPVGAVSTIELPLLIALIASTWKSSSGNGKISSRLFINSEWEKYELTS